MSRLFLELPRHGAHWEPVTWNEEERGTGTDRGATLPDSFIQDATPDVPGEAATTPEVLKEAIASLS